MDAEFRFQQLSELARALHAPDRADLELQVQRCQQLGPLCIPVLVRCLAGAPAEQALAHRLLVNLPAALHPRVLTELRGLRGAADHTKAAAQRVQLELGQPVGPDLRLRDPSMVQRQLAVRLAAQLEHRADVAAAAELMITRLAPPRLVELMLIVAEHAPASAAALASELACRTELAAELRVSLLRAVAAVPRRELPVSEIVWHRHLVRERDGAQIVAVIGRIGRNPGTRGRRGLVLWRGPSGELTRCWYDDASSIERLSREALGGVHREGYRSGEVS